MVDLDLDVVLTRDGDLLLDDEDEFDQHRVTLGYPDDLVAAGTAHRRRAAGRRLGRPRAVRRRRALRVAALRRGQPADEPVRRADRGC